MIISFLHQRNNAWLKLIIIFLLLLSLCTLLFMYYGQSLWASLIDNSIFSLLLFSAFIILENVFKNYIPTAKNRILVYIIPLVISIAILFLGDFILQKFAISSEINQDFLDQVFVLRAFIISIILVFYTVLININAKIKEQKEIEERENKIQQLAKESELYQLKQQLQPHFLFNSLNSISALINQKPEKAREMTLQLSDFLRNTIKKEANNWITAEEELKFLKLFTDIENVRFGHRLAIKFQFNDELMEMKLPHLLIQPILENAIKHSLYTLENDVEINVLFDQYQNNLRVRITNPYDSKVGQAKGSGFGLDAVNRRLFLIFGRYDLLKITDQDQTFMVDLTIPQQK
ncbi:sensor histidine kinase [Marivirga arenosa]|uniref:Histidine kinase n=1 Tax=Marivirga arenosa TaxID=3059076 RepID=A0AA51ZXK8_9BACT|nr:histidine kinase [Marivirga sp. BKB1-2]WNB18645.1 histidine kinase [Marivirga sp. BKB1-2]